MDEWSPSGCQVWARSILMRLLRRWVWHQCTGKPVVAKDSVSLCKKHKDLKVEDGRAIL